jgi:hypothetical protein
MNPRMLCVRCQTELSPKDDDVETSAPPLGDRNRVTALTECPGCTPCPWCASTRTVTPERAEEIIAGLKLET